MPDKNRFQSPINLDSRRCNNIIFFYKNHCDYVRNTDNEETLMIMNNSDNYIIFDNEQYRLDYFYFVCPSGHTIDCKRFDMEMRLVHSRGEGDQKQQVIVSVFINRRKVKPSPYHPIDNLFYDCLYRCSKKCHTSTSSNNAEPADAKEEDPLPCEPEINLNCVLPEDRRYFTYRGSMTEAPFTENVQWVVMKEHIELSTYSFCVYARNFKPNAREHQRLCNRNVYHSRCQYKCNPNGYNQDCYRRRRRH